jgi:penicillin-binding protein 1B
MDLGLDAVAARLDGLGVKRPIERLPSMLLGAISLSPLEVAQVYQTLGAGGFYSPLRAIREVLDAQGRPLSRYPLSVSRAAPSGAVYLVDFILQETVRSGTGRSLRKLLPEGLELAGKTGTTNDLRDSWFAGFSGGKVAVVWVGRDDNRPAGLSGSQGALWVWGDIMRHSRPQPLVLLPPDDVESVWIEPRTGVLSAEGCEGARLFPFLKGSAPTVRSSCAEREERGFIENLFQGWFE